MTPENDNGDDASAYEGDHAQELSIVALLRIRQLGDKGLRTAMRTLNGEQ